MNLNNLEISLLWNSRKDVFLELEGDSMGINKICPWQANFLNIYINIKNSLLQVGYPHQEIFGICHCRFALSNFLLSEKKFDYFAFLQGWKFTVYVKGWKHSQRCRLSFWVVLYVCRICWIWN